MNDQEQRIAIAEECGWHDFRETVPDRGSMQSRTLGFIGKGVHPRLIPDYLNDLNAMHEAEKVLTMDQCRIFDELLWTNSESCASIEFKWHSPANARAEAFLKTLNLWKD